MKKTMTFAVAILAILWAGSMCIGQEKGREKRQGNRGKVSAEQKAWQEKIAKMTPEQQQAARAKKAFEAAVAPWRKVRLIAVKEKATKTVAAIDQIIAAKEKQFKRRLGGQGKTRPQTRAKKQGEKKVERKVKARRKDAKN